MSFEPFIAAAVQMVSGSDVSENFAAAAGSIEEAARQDARLIVLPENFAIMGRTETDKLKVREDDGDGPIQRFLGETARRYGVWLVAGSVHLVASSTSLVRNSCLVYDDRGQRVARYDKIHLFGFEAGSERYRESDTIEPGSGPPLAFDSHPFLKQIVSKSRFGRRKRAPGPVGLSDRWAEFRSRKRPVGSRPFHRLRPQVSAPRVRYQWNGTGRRAWIFLIRGISNI